MMAIIRRAALAALLAQHWGDTGATTPMPEPVVRMSTGCSFSCALERLRRGRRGGTLFVPAGTWLSPPVNLTSHLTVFLAEGAVLKADTRVFAEGRWPLIAPLPNYGRGHPDQGDTASAMRWAPFLNGYDVTNLTIGGENGTIDGSGMYWWARHEAKLMKYTRPPLWSCVRCTDMLLEDTTFKDSAFWTIHPVLGRRLTARRLYILTPPGAPNTDGFDPDSTSDVLFEHSYIANGDDAVAIKAGWDCAGYGYNSTDGGVHARTSDNITIRNITQQYGGGGIAIGSEMSGGVSNVVVQNVRLYHGSYGIYIKTGLTRGGFVKNVSVRGVELVDTIKQAITIDGFYTMVNEWCPDPSKYVPSVVDNISISDVVVHNANLSVHFRGVHDAPASRVRLRNVSFSCDGAAVCSATHGWPRNCCLAAECDGGVEFAAAGITPPTVFDGCSPGRSM